MRRLVRDMLASLLLGEAGDSVRLSAILAEGILKSVLGQDPSSRLGLGELIREVHSRPELVEQLGRPRLGDLNWLNTRRIPTVHFKGGDQSVTLEDAERASDIVAGALVETGLLSAQDLDGIKREAEWKASSPATTSVLKLDRAVQRAKLDDLLGLQRPLLVLLVEGEAGQGHEAFGQVTGWRLRAIPRGHWREIRIEWPRPSANSGVRLAELIERLADEVGASIDLPSVSPLDESGSDEWAARLAPLVDAIASHRRRMFVRHTIGWVGRADPRVIDRYLHMVWGPAAERAVERMLVTFEIVRAEAAGVPWLTKGWRLSRAERRVTRQIARRFDAIHLPETRCRVLDELTSVSVNDLVDWFRDELDQPRERAESLAEEVVSATRGGRFELVVRRIASSAMNPQK